MQIQIITVGSKPFKSISTMLDDYNSRLPKSIACSWHFIKNGVSGDVKTSKQQESESILRLLKKNSRVILLDETGKQFTSENFSSLLFGQPKHTTFIIGGAYGVSDEIKNRADLILSLSELVFPHQIVRLILSEQIYRAYTISVNHPYHHAS